MPLQLQLLQHHLRRRIWISRHSYLRTFVVTRTTSMPNRWTIILLPNIYSNLNGLYVCLSQGSMFSSAHVSLYVCVYHRLCKLGVHSLFPLP
jgi:hypothetical protein